MLVRRPRRDLGRDRRTARSGSPRTPAPRWPGSGSCGRTPPTGPGWSGRAASRTRSGAAPTAAARFELVRGLWDHPHRPTWAARRRRRRRAHGAARPVVGSGDGRDEHRRGLRQRGRRREVGAAQPRHQRRLPARPAARVRPVRAQGRRRRGRPRPAVRAEPRRRLPQSTTPACAGRRSPTACRPTSASRSSPRRTTPGTAWVVPLVADMQRVPAGRPAARAPDARRGGDVDGGGQGPARRRLDVGAARRVLRRRRSDPTGIYLGTRDGCVYASADEGDSFTLVADHLPDVLTVKAAQLP